MWEPTGGFIDEILLPAEGEPVGELLERGADPRVCTVSGNDFAGLKARLLPGLDVGGNYAAGKGTWYLLPDGGRIGVRQSDQHGETLDIDIPGYAPGYKVHAR